MIKRFLVKIKKQLKFPLKRDIITKVRRKREPYAGIAQSVEHFTRNEGVVSSSLISGLIMTARQTGGLL